MIIPMNKNNQTVNDTALNVEMTYPFMIRCAIPIVEKKSRPSSLPDASNFLWDSIFRAHRDALAGRQFLPAYCSTMIDGNPKRNRRECHQINGVAAALYSILSESTERIYPRDIINRFHTEVFVDVEVGAIQKLVNMTFKYLYILKLYNVDEDSINNVLFNLEDCDCPLDSKILQHIEEYRETLWTQIDMPTYINIQEEVDRISRGEPRLMFDFENFQQVDFGASTS